MCVGPLGRLCHWGPLTALSIIKIISLSTIHCNMQWYPPSDSLGGTFHAVLFLVLSSLTVYHFLSSLCEGPGLLPLGWKPVGEPGVDWFLQVCVPCGGYKAPRSHHCKKCGRCVLKMDHHCPWINSCVGHLNHGHFTLFLLFAVLGCLQACVVLTCCLYRAVHRSWYLYHGSTSDPVITLNFTVFITCVFALGLSIGVVLAVGMLFYFQMRAIIRNRTGIEDWILEKANHRRLMAKAMGREMEEFIFPYHLGMWNNIKQVLRLSLTPPNDGITWPLIDHPSVDQYTLTKEQMEQKTEKRHRARLYTVSKCYSGRWLPLSHGWSVLFSVPCTDESRLPLNLSESLSVTRWRRHWLFGERIEGGRGDTGGPGGPRGWFPRCCVMEVDGPGPQTGDREKME